MDGFSEDAHPWYLTDLLIPCRRLLQDLHSLPNGCLSGYFVLAACWFDRYLADSHACFYAPSLLVWVIQILRRCSARAALLLHDVRIPRRREVISF